MSIKKKKKDYVENDVLHYVSGMVEVVFLYIYIYIFVYVPSFGYVILHVFNVFVVYFVCIYDFDMVIFICYLF